MYIGEDGVTYIKPSLSNAEIADEANRMAKEYSLSQLHEYLELANEALTSKLNDYAWNHDEEHKYYVSVADSKVLICKKAIEIVKNRAQTEPSIIPQSSDILQDIQTVTAKKSNAPLYIFGGVAVALLGWLALGKNKRKKK